MSVETALLEQHLCVNGEVIEYPTPSTEVGAFLSRARMACEDPKVTPNELIALIYGRSNPLLNHSLLPGHSMVTKAVFENPVYHVLADLLGRKEIQAGLVDLKKVRSRFTMTVTEAAEKLGVNTSAIRKAIGSRRLDCWKEGGQYFLDPRHVDNFRVDRRGPSPRLQVAVGGAKGISLSVKHTGNLSDTSKKEGILSGTLATHWERVAVLTSASEGEEKSQRLFILEPGGEENVVELGPLFVRGRFRVASKENNSRLALDAWKEFEPT